MADEKQTQLAIVTRHVRIPARWKEQGHSCEGPKHWKVKKAPRASCVVWGQEAGPLPVCFECFIIISEYETHLGYRVRSVALPAEVWA